MSGECGSNDKEEQRDHGTANQYPRGLCVSSEGAKIAWAAFKDDRQGCVASKHGGLFALSTASPLKTSRFSGQVCDCAHSIGGTVTRFSRS